MASVVRDQPGTLYVDKDGDRITKQKWQELRADRSYKYIREFENTTLYAAVLWHGEVPEADRQHEDHWKVYRLVVCDVRCEIREDMSVTITKEPNTEHSRAFGSETEAIEAYEDLLVRKAKCRWVPSPGRSGNAASLDYHFLEVDNRLAKAAPNMPEHRDMTNPEIVGSW